MSNVRPPVPASKERIRQEYRGKPRKKRMTEAASVPTDPENNILEITREFQCPEPLAKVIYRVEDME
jgi:hypothetical protein